MSAALLYLAVLLMLTSVGHARPIRSAASLQSCRPGQYPMPDLSALLQAIQACSPQGA